MQIEQSSPPILLQIRNLSVVRSAAPILHDLNFTIRRGEQWAVVGNSGSGKTMLASVIAGRIPYQGSIEWHLPQDNKSLTPVVLVEQQHRFKNISMQGELYYQQRYHSIDADDALTAAGALASDCVAQTEQEKRWLDLLHLTPLLASPLVQLSNGEHKRFQIAQALFENPALLILDNPFLGLDREGRTLLQTILLDLCKKGIQIMLLESRGELPSCITNIAELDRGRLVQSVRREEYKSVRHPDEAGYVFDDAMIRRYGKREDRFAIAVKMTDVSVRYGEKSVLKNIFWEVRRGERWLVSGPNGAGKTTLLSLINADHPQAYANDLILFDRRRGSGESIWDVKQKIGFVSPEMQLSLQSDLTCEEAIASGLFDALGVFRRPNAEEKARIEWWIDVLQVQAERFQFLNQLPFGRQRILLLARALIKNPPMLILDEPCQGLDEEQTVSFLRLTEKLCLSFDTTLIYVSHVETDVPSCVTHELRLERGSVVRIGKRAAGSSS
jgi:molybdate transport system ATP-binding protein